MQYIAKLKVKYFNDPYLIEYFASAIDHWINGRR